MPAVRPVIDEKEFSPMMKDYLAYIEAKLKKKKLADDKYQEEYGRYEKIVEEKQPLKFDTQEDVQEFLTEQAKVRPFMALEVDADGKPTGKYWSARGDGKLHEGQMSPEAIEQLLANKDKTKNPEIANKIFDALEKKDESALKAIFAPSSTNSMRAQVMGMKAADEAPAAAEEEELGAGVAPSGRSA